MTTTARPGASRSWAPTIVLACSPAWADALARALGTRGWDVRAGFGPSAAPASRPDLVVFEMSGDMRQADMALVEALGVGAGGPELVLLDAGASEAERRWGASLTPFLFPADMLPETLARLLERVRERPAAPRDRAAGPPAARTVTIRLWESVEVDGREVYLGAAERNFLFLLAGRAGVRISKVDEVESGPRRRVAATECRRRLGRRLGPELADLLVPVRRGEPYRLREPAEVDALAAAGEGHPPTRLRIIGRAGVRGVSLPGLESLAGSA